MSVRTLFEKANFVVLKKTDEDNLVAEYMWIDKTLEAQCGPFQSLEMVFTSYMDYIAKLETEKLLDNGTIIKVDFKAKKRANR